jgi:hypothetical protein
VKSFGVHCVGNYKPEASTDKTSSHRKTVCHSRERALGEHDL